jgi:phosphoribosylamine--glycine ligase
MQETNEKYIGILYGGYMATAHGVYVIEFNARFGDPEALNVLSILESDFIELCCALTEGTLKAGSVKFAHKATVCKYAVPEGYPDNPVNNVAIDISTITDEAGLYLAAVNRIDDTLYATGSRTAAFVGIADSISGAEHIAEQGIRKVKGPLFHREDIGTAQMINKRVEAMRTLRVSELY